MVLTDLDEIQEMPIAMDLESVALLTDMGFHVDQARRALKETNGITERAVEWLFSHASELSAADTDSSRPAGVTPGSMRSNEGQYMLQAFISHKGPSVHYGHYICHIQQPEANPHGSHSWIMFNDQKIAWAPNPPTGEAYMYFLRRIK
jgi:ubiquitin carboxyl-terminal hydrolase 5/13